MEILTVTPLHGPNHLTADPVLIVQIRCPETALSPSSESKLRSRVAGWLADLKPQMQRATPLASQAQLADSVVFSRFTKRLSESIVPVEFVQYLAQILQLATGVNSEYGHTVAQNTPDLFEIAIQFEVEALARAALESAIAIWKAASQDDPVDFIAATRTLINLADDVRLGPSTRAIVDAATRRGIPYRRLTTGSLVQLGEGKRQRRIWTAETDATGAIAQDIAQNKSLTKKLLYSLGVPVPRGRLVNSADDAWQAACEIGTPVAVKPSQSNHAQGVSLNLFTREQVATAFAFAQKVNADNGSTDSIIVEQFISGEAYRLLVVGGRLVAAAKSEMEFLTGDGTHTIRQLIDEANRDPRRGENYTDPLALLDLEVPTLMELEKQGLSPDSIPVANQRVLLHMVGDYTTDCTAEVHPDTAQHVSLAARLIGLDVAGIDIVARDISRSLIEQRGAILEVNAGPSLGMHIAPLRGKPQPVGEAILNQLYPANASGRIPVFVVAGDGDRTAITTLLERLLKSTEQIVGRADRDGLTFAGRKISTAHATDFENTEALLLHPDVEIAILESRGEEAITRGLACSRADIAVVTESASNPNIDPPANSLGESQRLGALAAIRAVPPNGSAVLSWSEWSRNTLAPACRGRVIYCTSDAIPTHSDANFKKRYDMCWRRGNDLVITRSAVETATKLPADWWNASVDPTSLLMSLCGVVVSGLCPNFD